MAPKAPADKLLGEWFWTDRWMGSSAFLLPLEPRGLYREMLTQAWRRGARLPNDHETIQRAVGCTAVEWKRCWPKVERYWRVDGTDIVNDTQLEVYAKCQEEQQRASARGRKGARARAQALAQARAQALAQASTQASAHAPPEELLEIHPPDPDPEERSKDQERSTRGRARVFTGTRLKVSQAQHQVLLDEHGDRLDWLGLYAVWDEQLVASGKAFDTLVFIKRRAADRVQALRSLGPAARPRDPEEDARRDERAAEQARREAERREQLEDLWLLVGESVRRELRETAAADLKPFQARMTVEARETALDAAARRLLDEKFPGRDAKLGEIERLRSVAVAS